MLLEKLGQTGDALRVNQKQQPALLINKDLNPSYDTATKIQCGWPTAEKTLSAWNG